MFIGLPFLAEAANDNPLSLLGQYSDDEADEDDNPSLGPTNNIGNEAGEDFTKNQDEQVLDFVQGKMDLI